ncbi:MAG TPA: histidine kinase [Mycobacteriales bacterium]|nr:histidine kinase [Mycobacteriales bacterium]
MLTALVQTLGTSIASRGEAPNLNVLGYVLLVVSGLALSDRHRSPRTTLLVVAVPTVAYHVLHYPHGPTFLGLIVAAAAAARAGHRGMVWATMIASYIAWVVLSGATRGQALAVAGLAVGVALLTGFALFAGQQISQMVQEQRRLADERKRRQASDERLRIAQELHDVLGHHLSLINVRAGVGLHLMDRQPDQARAALDTIKQASAEALREVQSVLNALYPSGEAAPRAPAPGLDRLDDLTVDAGLPVRTTISGTGRPLPAEIDRAAYRIVQEALTNVRRHAGPGATASITIEYQPEELTVQITDDGGAHGPVTAPVAAGNGISGMRERAAALGGALTAQPLLEGGWQVRGRLPLPPPDPADPADPASPADPPVPGGAAEAPRSDRGTGAGGAR